MRRGLMVSCRSPVLVVARLGRAGWLACGQEFISRAGRGLFSGELTAFVTVDYLLKAVAVNHHNHCVESVAVLADARCVLHVSLPVCSSTALPM